MAITTYAELQTAITGTLARSDLSSKATEFIALAEADMRRKLRDTRTTAGFTTIAGQRFATLPTGIKNVEMVAFNTSSMQQPLRQKSMQGLAEIVRVGTGIPTAYAIAGATIYFDVSCADAYLMFVSGIGTVTPLSVSNTTNSTLTNSPDIYLYGSLLHSAPYLEHDERIGTWQSFYEAAIQAENIARDNVDMGGAAEMQMPVVFGELD